MYKYLTIISIVALAGCSSTKTTLPVAEPYCYTDQTIQKQGDIVNSNTTLECTDNPLKRAKLVGVDEKNCRRWSRTDQVGKNLKTYGGYICRDAKGNWRPLSSY